MASPTADTPRRVRAVLPAAADVVIVGASLGGLLAAAWLARAGLSVAVLDGHYVAGGCATMFARGPADARFVFDVGVHYLGEGGAGQRVRRWLDAAGADVTLRPLDPDGFDTLQLPGLTVTIPWEMAAWRDRLVGLFPGEQRGIDRYFRALRQLDVVARKVGEGAPPWRVALTAVSRAPEVVRWQGSTIADLLDTVTRDPLLRAALLGLTGDVGAAPARGSALLYLGLSAHYFRGGYYPQGGGQAMADALAASAEAAGAVIALRRPVARILVRGGAAVGVRTRDGQEVAARAVLSSADVLRTFGELLPPDVLPPALRARLPSLEPSVGLVLLSLGLRGTPAELGLPRGNVWAFDTLDLDGLYRGVGRGVGPAHAAFITSGSAKDPGSPGHAPPGHSTLQAMAMVPGRPTAWGTDDAGARAGTYRRAALYEALKASTTESLLALTTAALPRIAGAVVRADLATPLSHTRYTDAVGGTAYGLAAIVGQVNAGRPGPVGPVDGLFLSGAGTRSAHGIVGSLTGGATAARLIARRLGVSLAGG